ncbi:FCD domain-containing protein [Saxibacter everestensis]|uniref:FCD domain-containing protein n=1 Tax=Saxibacter everestensis TaxID=2909229 RepID=A0ABY8QWX4_9MICO|nr:FCD domain-containing protein [Brevibacteriaceae bacterium ZFBP1038]
MVRLIRITARGLHGQLLESVGQAIAIGELSEDQQISPETMAEEANVSRTVVREVLKVLEGKGMVGARPRTGTRVRAADEWDLLDPDVIRWRAAGPDKAKQLDDLMKIRSAVEPLAARGACENATASNMTALNQALDAMQAASANDDPDAFTAADVRFHRELIRSGGNLILAQLAAPIEAVLRVRRELGLTPDRITDEALDNHRAIVRAISDRDEAAAEIASRKIVDVAGAEIWARLESDEKVPRAQA